MQLTAQYTRTAVRNIMFADNPPSGSPDPMADNQLIHPDVDGCWFNATVGAVVSSGNVYSVPFRLWLFEPAQGWFPWKVVRVLTGQSREDSTRIRLPRRGTPESIGGFTEYTPAEGGIVYGARDIIVHRIEAVAFQMLDNESDGDGIVYTVNVAVDDDSNFL
jgi:hypothetical protein